MSSKFSALGFVHTKALSCKSKLFHGRPAFSVLDSNAGSILASFPEKLHHPTFWTSELWALPAGSGDFSGNKDGDFSKEEMKLLPCFLDLNQNQNPKQIEKDLFLSLELGIQGLFYNWKPMHHSGSSGL